MNLIENWRAEATRLWSMRLVLFWTAFWSALGGLVSIWSALDGLMPKGLFIALGILMPISIGIARLLKQPGADD